MKETHFLYEEDKDKRKKENKLKVDSISLKFGGINALDDVSFDIGGKKITAIIGPNGAGKTSMINCISGFYWPQRGKISFNDIEIHRLPPHKITGLGISRTFQNIQLYTGLSVVDNLMAARHIHLKPKLITSALYYFWEREKEIKHRRAVEEIIDFMELQAVRHKIVGSLPYGERKKVDFGRALALEPNILLLDEPMAGMNVEEKEDMARFILDVNELSKIPIILVEHDMEVVMDICDEIIVLDFGKKVAQGSPDNIKTNPEVIKVYLGEGIED